MAAERGARWKDDPLSCRREPGRDNLVSYPHPADCKTGLPGFPPGERSRSTRNGVHNGVMEARRLFEDGAERPGRARSRVPEYAAFSFFATVACLGPLVEGRFRMKAGTAPGRPAWACVR